MARWIDGREPGSGYWTNTDLASCELCGVDLGPGDARLRRCHGCDEHTAVDPRGEPKGGAHARCRDEGACRRRQAGPAPGKRELAAAVRAEPAPEPTLQPAAPCCDAPQRAAQAPAPAPDPLADLERRMVAAELLEQVIRLVAQDGALTAGQRMGTAKLLRACTVQTYGLLVDLHAGPFVVAQLSREPRYGAVRAAAAACIAHDLDEHGRVELVLTEVKTERQVA